jgi:hypothetical protein
MVWDVHPGSRSKAPDSGSANLLSMMYKRVLGWIRRDSMDRSASAFSSLDYGKSKAWPNYGTLGQYTTPPCIRETSARILEQSVGAIGIE